MQSGDKVKKLFCLTAAIVAAVFLVGRTAIVETKVEPVMATIGEINVEPAVKYKVPFVEPDTYIVDPAEFEVVLKYDGVILKVTDTSFYRKYKDLPGAEVPCELTTHIYNDGTVRRSLKLLEEKG